MATNPITALQIGLQMVHRLLALGHFCAGGCLPAWKTRRATGGEIRLTKIATDWFGLLCLQVILGAATIWSHKSADIATAHVAVGALSLVTGALLFLVATRCLKRRKPQNDSVPGVRRARSTISME